MSIIGNQEKKGQRKYLIDYGIKDYYKFYKIHADSYVTKSKYDTEEYQFKNPIVEYKEFTSILREFFSIMSNEIMQNNEEFKIPYKFGSISIKKFKPKVYTKRSTIGLPIDWAASKKLGKKVYFTNDNRDGFVYRWKWTKQYKSMRSVNWYKFISCRANKRALAVVLKDKTKDFLEQKQIIYIK